ncbi:MAG: VWA domain-containing protein [Deltaproteobacteria bacterium]|nr:VWA domain-containing protein [Deltaproteobacteria bacterium]
MSEFRFAEPQWAHALWGVLAFVALLFWFDLRGAGALDRLIANTLQRRLVRRPSSLRRRMRIALLGLSAVCLVLALMRPQLGIRHVAAPRVGAEIMIALDVSKSMLAEDVAPNRLERAKAEIVDLLAYLEGDQVGLIAFAGRATVLAPMTPDFSFLRLVLEGAGPHSVTRGGTRLEEPIRKATQGFGPAREASRVILLITDGGDHDSFPLDAAKDAAEAGIVIIAIGFGDELGSEIYITDPRTGARELLRDADGRAVKSRLDGELLRDLALATGGAYVPAGTGMLDLESIYRRHIEPRMVGQLDPRGKTVRDEGYQWAVLLGLVFLVSSVAIYGGPAGVGTALALWLVVAFPPPPASAQIADQPADADAVQLIQEPDGDGQAGADTSADAADSPAAPADPREIFNLGVEALEAGNAEEAIRQFESARRGAGDDGELRFRAAYDLGIASAMRASALEADSPEEALRALYVAADWFRDAVQQRPEHEDSRVNLDVVLRRALLLADRIAQANAEGVDAELRQLAERQREMVAALANLQTQLSEASDAPASELLRREFRARATDQRALLSDADRLAGAIDAESQGIAARPEQVRTPEDQMRAAQLEGVLHYLHLARERMGQTRRQLRQRQGERAYRRGSAALAELKRALDQLRDPAAAIDALIGDVAETASGTAALAGSRRELPGMAAPVEIPAWLTAESLRDDQRYAAERAAELDRRLLAGLEQQSTAGPEQQELLDAVKNAEPLVADSSASLSAAADALEVDAPEDALPHQREALVALAEAREWFLDLRGLIELTYSDERRIEQVLGAEGDEAETARKEYLSAIRELQLHNVARGERLAGKFEAAASAPPAPLPDGSTPDEETAEIQQQRFELAGQLLTLALARMDDVGIALAEGGAVEWSAALEASRAAVEHLEALRRLFFSIVEELRDAAQQQLDLADETRDAAALSAAGSDDAAARIGPLAPRQEALAARTGAIADALVEQSNQTGGVVDEEADSAETSRRLREAAEHVLLAQVEMEGATEKITEAPPNLELAQERQAASIAELEQALALLVPPEQRQPEGEPDPSEQGDSESESSGGEQKQQGEPEPQAAPADPAQLLQAVRDREAQRRRDREQRGTQGYDTVEKDW